MFRLFTYMLCAIICFSACPAFSEEVDLAGMETQLYTLINQARINPLETAASLGMDPDKVLNDLPGLNHILTQGLPALTYSTKLGDAAQQHTTDMLEKDFYDSVSPEGTTPDTRIDATGYIPAEIGESLGILGFVNFIKPSDAVRQIFEKLYRDELAPDRVERRYILASDFEEIGIGFGAGVMTIGSGRYNAYLVTCDFGISAVSSLESELLILINQARANPLEMAEFLGMDVEQIMADDPDLEALLESGLPPLTFNADLYEAATSHAQDMLNQQYFSHISPDGITPEERIAENGYTPSVSGESISSLLSGSWIDPEKGAVQVFESMFRDELRRQDDGQRNILNPLFTEAGIRFQRIEGGSGADDDLAYSYHLIVCDFGAPVSPQSMLTGVVYHDADLNGLYSMGEGIAGAEIAVDGPSESTDVVSDEVGQFAMQADPGIYILTAQAEEVTEAVTVETNDQNVWIGIEN